MNTFNNGYSKSEIYCANEFMSQQDREKELHEVTQ